MITKINIKKIVLGFAVSLLSLYFFPLMGQATDNQQKAKIVVNADLGVHVISKHIYGHFSEHLGNCIYGGYWVGEDSEIPNTRGIRNDVVEALKKTNIPNLRWPGGCFADEYHWMDGIGPREDRPEMINTHWGGVTEDNSFGTHEFFDLCQQLNTEPVICGNVGSGTVEEMSKWVEYINSDNISPMADLRRKNGQEKAWGIKYWDVGNENWGCGGHMTAEFYADQYKRYATFCRNYGENRLRKIAGGANSNDLNWTETLMKKIPHWMMWGISLHYYTTNWRNKGSATEFGEDLYFDILDRCLNIAEVIDKHITIMDKYDPEKRVALVFDEWGTWYNVEPGTNPGFLFQQNTLRDALVAGLSLNYLNERCERVKMANIAQTVNVLQALIFTKEDKILLTPTYHIFEMYKVHHDATLLPLNLKCGDYEYDGKKLPSLSASASMDADGIIHISIVNIHPEKDIELTLDMRGTKFSKISGRILTSDNFTDHNTFDDPENLKPAVFEDIKMNKNEVAGTIPAKSIIVLEIK
ncbi:MAG: alpha-N-arabinofuranosidase [Bacteroidales bacterium]|nr:MAG: alpha-N-arabinofuranosidase [Bacteroidales bacterium]